MQSETTPMCGATGIELTGGVVALSSVSTALVVDILLASAANAINQADRNIVPIAVIPMAEEFGWSLVQRSLMLSSFAYGYILTQLPGGWIATRIPPLRLLLVAVSGWSFMTLLTVYARRVIPGARCGLCVPRGHGCGREGFCLPAIFQLFAKRVPDSLRSRAFACMLGCGSVGQLTLILALALALALTLTLALALTCI